MECVDARCVVVVNAIQQEHGSIPTWRPWCQLCLAHSVGPLKRSGMAFETRKWWQGLRQYLLLTNLCHGSILVVSIWLHLLHPYIILRLFLLGLQPTSFDLVDINL